MLTQRSFVPDTRNLQFASVIVALSLAACTPLARAPAPTTPVPQQHPAEPSVHTPAAVAAAAPADMAIDAEQTVVTIIVRRAGALARLGHDHVITSADETGSVSLGNSPETSSFDVELAVDKLAVDLPDARSAAGAEFAAPVPDSAREGTRQNMLRPEVLDGTKYPVISLRSLGATGTWADALVRVAVTIKGRETEVSVPVQMQVTAAGVVARGSFELRQTELGLQPFSVAGGVIQVADTMEIRFVIAAAARGER